MSGIGDEIFKNARAFPDAPALLAPEAEPLTYARLASHIRAANAHLNSHGIGRGDRVGLVVSRPAVALSAYLATASSATAVPINPEAALPELERLFTLLKLGAVIVSEDLRDVAALAGRLSLPTFMIGAIDGEGAGVFSLRGGFPMPAKRPGYASGQDVACVQLSSGTTGRPKASLQSHACLLFRAHRDRTILELSRNDVTINFRPHYMSGPLNVGLLSSIVAGGSVVVPARFDADEFYHCLGRYGITWYTGGPAYHRAILERASAFGAEIAASRLRFVRSAGYALPERLQAQIEATFGVPCIQKYGSSEAGLVSCNPLPPGRRKSGRAGPVVDCELRIVSDDGRDLPTGESGEIWVRGSGVFEGYDDPAMNASAFVDGWFRTGDLGSLDEDGYLAVSGRKDEIINRGGQKISPREVEEVFASLPGVERAFCFPVPHATLGDTAGLAVIPKPGEAPDPDGLRALAMTQLSRFKVPESVVVTDAFPVGPAGKPLRRGAAEHYGLTGDRPQAQPSGRPPRDRLESIWCDTLKLDAVADDQNFTAMGGDSLRAMRLVLLIEEAFGARLSNEIVYGEGATFGGLRDFLDAAETVSPSSEVSGPKPRRKDPSAPLGMTSSQKRVWSICQTFPDVALYNSAFGLRFAGAPDFGALRAAVNLVVARHEALRAVFPHRDGKPFQLFLPELVVELSLVDLRDVPAADRERCLKDRAREKAQRAYDLAAGPLVRADAFLVSEDDTVLLVQMHHIIGDAISTGILSREISAAYRAYRLGADPDLPPVEWSFGDFVEDQAARLDETRRQELLDFWTGELDGTATRIDLPADRRRPTVATHRGRRIPVGISGPVAASMRAVAAECGVSVFVLALSAFQVLLGRVTGLDDFIVGTAIDTRPGEVSGQIVGFGLNTIPLRARLDARSDVRSLARGVQATLARCRDNAEVPFDELVRRLVPDRRDAVPPLVQVVFGMMPRGTRPSDLDTAEASLWNFDHDRARFDLTVMLDETGNGMGGFAEFSTDLFDTETIELLLDRFGQVLQSFVADPGRPIAECSVLPPSERLKIDRFSAGPARNYPADRSIAEVFSEVAERSPSAVAIVHGRREITYSELADWSDAIAHRLVAEGGGSGDVIAMSSERTPAAIAGLLAILKAGAAYCALDPSLPAARIARILEDSKARMVLLQDGSACPVGADLPVLQLPQALEATLRPFVPSTRPGASRDLAYICYTSGSTGEPKGVEIEQRSVLRLVLNQTYAALGPDDRIAQTGSFGFDASTFEIWGALLNGGTVVQPEEPFPSINDLAELLIRQKVTTVWFTAGLFRQMVDLRPDCFRSVRQVLAGGDVLSADHVLKLMDAAPDCIVTNGYGPTENTTFSLCATLDRGLVSCGTLPIGRPIANSTAYILDSRMRPVPIGVEGDLFVGGDGLARGYRGQPDLTEAAFVPDPFAGAPDARMYRTGDRARLRRDGQIEFLGRQDSQIKIRGFRVELGEIEAVLRENPSVRDAVVIANREDGVVRSLDAAVVSAEPDRGDPATLLAFLKERLPDYMIPARFMFTDGFPLNASGKIDRTALAAAFPTEAVKPQTSVAPRTPVESLLADLWRDLLKIETVGIDDDFFEMGGHSLLVMQLAFRIEEETGLEMPQIDFFAHSTIRRLAAVIFDRLMELDPTASGGREPAECP